MSKIQVLKIRSENVSKFGSFNTQTIPISFTKDKISKRTISLDMCKMKPSIFQDNIIKMPKISKPLLKAQKLRKRE